jgi:DNA-binding transcriptional ArsR family regulator
MESPLPTATARHLSPAETTLDALGNPVRREILAMLMDEPQPVGEIAARFPISRPAISKHLKLLEEAGLVAHEAQGTRRVYRLKATGFEAARGWLDTFWAEALNRFRLVAENTAPAKDAGSTHD